MLIQTSINKGLDSSGPAKIPQTDLGGLSNKAENLIESGAPGGTRTPDTLVRSQVLYPAELRAQTL